MISQETHSTFSANQMLKTYRENEPKNGNGRSMLFGAKHEKLHNIV